MIVVAIVALLAAVAVPGFLRARQRAQNAKFINFLRVASGAIEQYAMENNAYPPDSTPGVVPPLLLSYLDPTMDWTAPTPIGGRWDWEFGVFGVKAAISVLTPTADTEQLTAIDALYDDGNLSTGRFRTLSLNRYAEIVQE